MDLKKVKALVLSAVDQQPWVQGVGIGLVGPARRRGVVLTVTEGAREVAERLVTQLDLADTPVEIRTVGPIRTRDGGDPSAALG